MLSTYVEVIIGCRTARMCHGWAASFTTKMFVSMERCQYVVLHLMRTEISKMKEKGK